ncbi:MAG: DUF2911 domain-containing protein [Bryobacterales bacterium]|nr:DUF2911 domain-containing protein [Bryobacterales bacterium]
MKYTLTCAIVLTCLVSLVLAQPAGLKEAAVKMSGKAITLRYSELPAAGGQIAGKPAFLHTDSDLEVQGLAVPKGDYALFVVPDAKEWQLIINKQTGAQAATPNPKTELGRVPMDMKKAAAPADVLRMTLASYGNVAGKLELTYGTTVASVPFNLDTLRPSVEW